MLPNLKVGRTPELTKRCKPGRTSVVGTYQMKRSSADDLQVWFYVPFIPLQAGINTRAGNALRF